MFIITSYFHFFIIQYCTLKNLHIYSNGIRIQNHCYLDFLANKQLFWWKDKKKKKTAKIFTSISNLEKKWHVRSLIYNHTWVFDHSSHYIIIFLLQTNHYYSKMKKKARFSRMSIFWTKRIKFMFPKFVQSCSLFQIKLFSFSNFHIMTMINSIYLLSLI